MQKVILPSVMIIDVEDGQTEDATNATAVTPKKGKVAISKKEDNKKIEIDEEKLKKVVVPKVMIIDEGQTEDATSGIIAVEISGEENKKVKSLEKLKSYLRDILQMDRSNLKQLCKDKGVSMKGGPTLMHKYLFTLLQDNLYANGINTVTNDVYLSYGALLLTYLHYIYYPDHRNNFNDE